MLHNQSMASHVKPSIIWGPPYLLSNSSSSAPNCSTSMFGNLKERYMQISLKCLCTYNQVKLIHSMQCNIRHQILPILCLIPRTTVTSLSAKIYTLQDSSFVHQFRCSLLNVWENTQVARAVTSVFLLNTRWRHGRPRGVRQLKYRYIRFKSDLPKGHCVRIQHTKLTLLNRDNSKLFNPCDMIKGNESKIFWHHFLTT